MQDNGRGIPIDIHPTTGVTGMETAMTTLHAGAKFGGSGYKVSGGLHGVGAHVVNSLSIRMRVEVRRDGRQVFQEYSRGYATGPATDMLPMGGRGTTVTFKPDPQSVGDSTLECATLSQRLREMAYLNKGLEITLIDERDDNEITFHFEGGIASFVQHLNVNRHALHEEPFYVSRMVEDATVEIAVQYSDAFSETVLCFANCINTRAGGTHLTGFRSALTRLIHDYARQPKLSQDNMAKLQGASIRARLPPAVLLRTTAPTHHGPSSEKPGAAESQKP